MMVRLSRALERLQEVGLPTDKGLNTHDQQDVLDEISLIRGQATAPLQNLEHGLMPLVTFFILPLFALANAGVSLEGVGLDALTGGIALGIMVGLVIGKPVGIFIFTWAAVKLGIADLPKRVTWRQVFGVGLLGGIGFTMALFIAGLAFKSADQLDASKLGILVASLIAGVVGLVLLRASPDDDPD